MSEAPQLEVTRTYLEMRSPAELDHGDPPDPSLRIGRVGFCPPSFFRYLYTEVGRGFRWTDRSDWTDDAIRAHLALPEVSLWLLSSDAAPAGYFELRSDQSDLSVEVVHLGLLPDFHGRGWGRYLLRAAVERAWSLSPSRVWLHTCTLDHPSALPNYLKRGFTPVREERYFVAARPSD